MINWIVKSKPGYLKTLKRQDNITNLLTQATLCLLRLPWISCPSDKLISEFIRFSDIHKFITKTNCIWIYITSTSRSYRTYLGGFFLPLASLNIEITSSECFCWADVGKHHFLNSTVIFAGEQICTFILGSSCLRQLDRCRYKRGIWVTEKQKRLIDTRWKSLFAG